MHTYFRWIFRPQLWVSVFVLGIVGFTTVNLAQRQVNAQSQGSLRATGEYSGEGLAPIGTHDFVVGYGSGPPAAPKPPTANCARVACLALSFDDGPRPSTTLRILDILDREQVPATFFVVGNKVAGNESILRQMHQGGHEIGNHSWSHADMTELTPRQIRQQIKLTQQAIEAAGVPAPTLFRPPYGYIDKTMQRTIPLTFALWNEDPRDWAAHTPKQVRVAVEKGAHPGGMIILHDVYDTTADSLEPMLHNLKKRGYHFVTVSQLHELQPDQKGMFYGQH